jgi:pimeloyl-ACP methyl ester carboxylesterase
MPQQTSHVPDAVFIIGGWGCPVHWLVPLQQSMAEAFMCDSFLIELPAYGASAESDYSHSLDAWRLNWAEQIRTYRHPVIVGWSYGGMLAVSLAAQLETEVELQVVTLGSRPRFIGDRWSVFDESTAAVFRSRVVASASKGLSYFVALTARAEPKSQLLSLKKTVMDGMPPSSVLLDSLDHLYQLDVSAEWEALVASKQLHAFYFQEDSLFHVPMDIENQYLIAGSHLAPVTKSGSIVDRIKKVIFG